HFYLGNDVPRRIRDDPTLGGTLNLMDSLFDQDIINEKDFTYLIRAFDDIHCFDAVKLLKEHFNQNREDILNQSVQSLSLIMPHIFETLEADQEEDKAEIKFDGWKQNAVTIAGGNGEGNESKQLSEPYGIFIDNHQDIFIADYKNHRIVKWKLNETQGKIIAGGNGYGSRMDQLNRPTNVIVDEEKNSLIIADTENRRVIQWSLNQNQQEILIESILCYGVTKDKYGYFYASDWNKNKVTRWKMGDVKGKQGTLVAGGNGRGIELNQFVGPTFIFVDDDQSIYVSDLWNHRVMKWRKDANEGIVVAGGNGDGNQLNQLNGPLGIIVDDCGNIYVADRGNDRIMRWSEGAKEGEIIVGGNGRGNELNQLSYPIGLSFDIEGNLYVADGGNDRISRFDLISS
ncbi:unnamed protein product, partial [Adineta ricciae]